MARWRGRWSRRGPAVAASCVACLGTAGASAAYRLRLATGAEPPEGLYGTGGPGQPVWEVAELRLFGDIDCQAPLSIAEPIASIGQAFGRAAQAFDGSAGTAWSSTCVGGEDASAACRSSWRGGAWLGARLAAAATLRCATLQPGGAPASLLLEAWDAAAGAWAALQEFGPFPVAGNPDGGGGVELLRLQGGACGAAALPLAPPAQGVVRLPSCEGRTQWRLVVHEAVLSWAVQELEFYRDPECRELVAGGLPITVGDEPTAARGLADGDFATTWSAVCSLADQGAGGRCSEGRLWVGLAFGQPEDILCARIHQDLEVRFGSGSSTRGRLSLEVWQGGAWLESQAFPVVGSGSWQYLPQLTRPRMSMWRLVNDITISAAWLVSEIRFMADEACTQPIAPSASSGLLSPDAPARLATEVPKALDGNPNTFWASSCTPCPPGAAYLGLSFDAPVVVRCVLLQQAKETSYRPAGASLEAWDKDASGAFGWRRMRSFRRLQPGLQYLGREWEQASTRFIILNAAEAPRGWRIAELRLFRDPACAYRISGVGMGSDEDPDDVAQAFDGRLDTFWHADCCADYTGLVECTGCRAYQASLGIVLLSNDTVECLQLVQKGGMTVPPGGEQPQGPLLFATSSIALHKWVGFRYERVYEWDNIPGNDWVELSVGKPRSALGSNLGCKDLAGWARCNASNDTCEQYRLEDRCNATYQEEADCGGLAVRVACRASCCLCEDSLPSHCEVGGGEDDSLPPWLIPVAAAGSALFVLVCCCGAISWKRRICHRTRVCARCCRVLDGLARRPPVLDEIDDR